MNRVKKLKDLLSHLSDEFEVECPQLLFPKTWKSRSSIAGLYTFDKITLNWFFVKNDIALALRTLRHEFAHYLQDFWNIEKKPEILARRFEKNSYALGILPKSQTKLILEFPE